MVHQPLVGKRPPHCLEFTGTPRHTTVVRSSVGEWSDGRRDFYQIKKEKKTISPGGIRTHNLNKLAAVDPYFRPRGHWDRPFGSLRRNISINYGTITSTNFSPVNIRLVSYDSSYLYCWDTNLKNSGNYIHLSMREKNISI
jgi:hypothetical protein